MIGISAYLAGSRDSLERLAQGLQVMPQNLLDQGSHTSDFSFYGREENGLFYTPVTGDFGFMCDINLFHVTPDQLRASLLALSAQGMVIAVPDEESASPFAYTLYEGGATRAVQIAEDDITEEVRLQRTATGQV